MANIPLKTIKFPGLDDTYTIPQVDNTLAVTGAAADAKKTGDEIGDLKEALTSAEATLSTKADKDGTVASAEQLLSDVGTEDKAPYLFRAVPYDSTRVDEEVVGVSVGWNQLVTFQNGTVTQNDIEIVRENGMLKINGTATGTVIYDFYANFQNVLTNGHKYLFLFENSGNARLINSFGGPNITTKTGVIIQFNTNDKIYLSVNVGNGATCNNEKVYPMCIDLTAWFGSTIADYAYTLEQATAGSGVAFIKALLPGGYIPYSAPGLKSVSGLSAHVMRDADENIVGNYPLDSDLTLRGILKMDSDHNVYADGDVYGSDGTVMRKYGSRAYQSGDESLTDAITDGTTTVYKLTTPATETADPYASPQTCEPGGTEEYVYAEGGSGVLVGHNSKYLKNMRSELERVSVAVPEVGSTAGTYVLKATVTAQGVTYGWVAE